MFVKGDALTRRQVDMMSATPEAPGVYCLVKMYSRDLNLVQEPLCHFSSALLSRGWLSATYSACNGATEHAANSDVVKTSKPLF